MRQAALPRRFTTIRIDNILNNSIWTCLKHKIRIKRRESVGLFFAYSCLTGLVDLRVWMTDIAEIFENEVRNETKMAR